MTLIKKIRDIEEKIREPKTYERIIKSLVYASIGTIALGIGGMGYHIHVLTQNSNQFESTSVGTTYQRKKAELNDLNIIKKQLPNLGDLIINQEPYHYNPVSLDKTKLDSLEAAIYGTEKTRAKYELQTDIDKVSKAMDELELTQEYQKYKLKENKNEKDYYRYLIVSFIGFFGTISALSEFYSKNRKHSDKPINNKV